MGEADGPYQLKMLAEPRHQCTERFVGRWRLARGPPVLGEDPDVRIAAPVHTEDHELVRLLSSHWRQGRRERALDDDDRGARDEEEEDDSGEPIQP